MLGSFLQGEAGKSGFTIVCAEIQLGVYRPFGYGLGWMPARASRRSAPSR